MERIQRDRWPTRLVRYSTSASSRQVDSASKLTGSKSQTERFIFQVSMSGRSTVLRKGFFMSSLGSRYVWESACVCTSSKSARRTSFWERSPREIRTEALAFQIHLIPCSFTKRETDQVGKAPSSSQEDFGVIFVIQKEGCTRNCCKEELLSAPVCAVNTSGKLPSLPPQKELPSYILHEALR